MRSILHFLPPLLLAGTAVASTPANNQLKVFHRLVLPSQPLPPFSPRGTIEIGGSTPGANPTLRPLPHAANDIQSWLEANNNQGYYQIAVQNSPNVNNQDEWNMQSVHACHLLTSTSDIITLQLSPSSSEVYAFDYYVAPIPHDGSCTHSVTKTSVSSLLGNTTVALRTLNFHPVTPLRTPPPLTETGQPLQPPPEKSFFEKYWMYAVGALIIFALAAPEAESEGGEKGGAPARK